MTDTLIGVSRRTARVAGTVGIIAVLGTAMLIEPALQARGHGTAALAIYALALPVLLWSVVEDLRRLRN
jgi:hypothetical protein